MQKQPAFFMADCLMALFVFLMGTAAVLSVYRSSERAYFNHKTRQKAWQILRNAEFWQRDSDSDTWNRAFSFEGEPVEENGFFTLSATHSEADPLHYFEYVIRYPDADDVTQKQKRRTYCWEETHEGL